jgi:hypothetical protein
LCAWLMVLPVIGFLPQISQTCAIGLLSRIFQLVVQGSDYTGFERVPPSR